MTIVLIDLSSIARPIYEAAIDVLSVHTAIVARVRELSSGQPHVAICCDAGRSFRKDIDSSYKANRSETPQAYIHQIGLAIETLRGDGFPVWSVDGFEADDLIGTACSLLVSDAEALCDVLIVSADKDLLCLVGERVRQFRPAIGTAAQKTYGVAEVVEKFGVQPHQMIDWLALVGDASDNIAGAKGIGPVGATALLNTFGNLDDLYAALDNGNLNVKSGTMVSLLEFRSRMPMVRQLLTLRADAPIPFEEVFRERRPADVAVFGADDDIDYAMPTLGATKMEEQIGFPPEIIDPAPAVPPLRAALNSMPAQQAVKVERAIDDIREVAAAQQQALARTPDVIPPVEWERQLEPRTMQQAVQLAQMMFAARLFNAYGSPEAVLSTLLAGRELGFQSMASLRAFHIIEGKPTLGAGAIHALVLKSGQAEYFRCKERTNERATFITKRKGDDEPTALTFTIEDARTAWTKEANKFATSGWGRNPADMCVARALTKLARLVYPDVLNGLYASEEFDS